MSINVIKSALHWNYFIALEQDMAQMARYIEFCKSNLSVFSIELAHLLLSASSEVDVMSKCVCKSVDPSANPKNIEDYRKVLTRAAQKQKIPDLSSVRVSIPRHGIDFIPWENWSTGRSPDWWKSYNQVKHQRDNHFGEATLQNALNALGALFILNYVHYRAELGLDAPRQIAGQRGFYAPSVVFQKLSPPPGLMTLPQDLHRTAQAASLIGTPP